MYGIVLSQTPFLCHWIIHHHPTKLQKYTNNFINRRFNSISRNKRTIEFLLTQRVSLHFATAFLWSMVQHGIFFTQLIRNLFWNFLYFSLNLPGYWLEYTSKITVNRRAIRLYQWFVCHHVECLSKLKFYCQFVSTNWIQFMRISTPSFVVLIMKPVPLQIELIIRMQMRH